jgi:uncharacterized protein (UPF0335 family)
MNDEINTATVHGSQLRSIIERIERLEEEKREIADLIKDAYAEAKGNGFDVAILRKVISLRKKSSDERSEEEAMLDLYLSALEMKP